MLKFGPNDRKRSGFMVTYFRSHFFDACLSSNKTYVVINLYDKYKHTVSVVLDVCMCKEN